MGTQIPYLPLLITVFLGNTFGVSDYNNTLEYRKACYNDFDPQKDGSCLLVSPRYITWTQAHALCKSRNSLMLEVHSITEHKQLKAFAKKKAISRAWLGGQSNGELWEWISSFPLLFESWAIGMPYHTTEMQCLKVTNTDEYRWSSVTCEKSGTARAICKYCPSKTVCRENQIKFSDGCCVCKNSGYTLIQDSEICVGQSGYNPNGQPEYAFDGDPKTYLYTLVTARPYVELILPERKLISSVSFKLRLDGKAGQKFCTREHDLRLSVTDKDGIESLCGYYKGVKKGEDCSGRLKLVKCSAPLKGNVVRLQVDGPGVMCSKAKDGEFCISDEVYMADNMNIISLTELEVSFQA